MATWACLSLQRAVTAPVGLTECTQEATACEELHAGGAEAPNSQSPGESGAKHPPGPARSAPDPGVRLPAARIAVGGGSSLHVNEGCGHQAAGAGRGRGGPCGGVWRNGVREFQVGGGARASAQRPPAVEGAVSVGSQEVRWGPPALAQWETVVVWPGVAGGEHQHPGSALPPQGVGADRGAKGGVLTDTRRVAMDSGEQLRLWAWGPGPARCEVDGGEARGE